MNSDIRWKKDLKAQRPAAMGSSSAVEFLLHRDTHVVEQACWCSPGNTKSILKYVSNLFISF